MNIDQYIKKYRLNFLSDNRSNGGDLDIFDEKKKLRLKFDKFLKKKKLIINKRYHKTGVRYDILNQKFELFCYDFLNCKETNPLFHNIQKMDKLKKINKIIIKFNFFFIKKFIINLFNYFIWRINIFFKQKNTFINIMGVDGAGKTYLADKIKNNINHAIDVKISHLWKFQDKVFNLSIPYKKKKYNLFLSIIKEIYIIINIILFFLRLTFFSKRKSIIIFERSLWDIVLDPHRYRLSHFPYLIKILISILMSKSYFIYLPISFRLSKKRKGELDYKKYLEINSKLNFFIKKQSKIKTFYIHA